MEASKYPLIKAINCFDPTVITANKTVRFKIFKSVCNRLIDAGRITATNADKVLIYWKFLKENSMFMETVKEFSSKFQDTEDSF